MIEEEDVVMSRAARTVAFPAGIAWGAVAAGSLVALAAQLVLAILGLGLGLGAVDVVSDPDAQSGTITGAVGVWWSVSALLSLFLGGWLAGRIAGGPFAPAGVFLGVLVWAAVTLASFYIVTTTVSTVLGGPLAVASDTVYSVLNEAEVQSEMAAELAEPPRPGSEQEDLEEMRAEAVRLLAARAEGAMQAGLWAAFALLLGGGAAVAGVWFATEPPAWAQPQRVS
ncbi:MAG TPA: hypothetical protein VE078_02065 [Thermoanaerobaculia bacterium]|nr:hypothetical protein [Thermoanaerobaculia bacterium]